MRLYFFEHLPSDPGAAFGMAETKSKAIIQTSLNPGMVSGVESQPTQGKYWADLLFTGPSETFKESNVNSRVLPARDVLLLLSLS